MKNRAAGSNHSRLSTIPPTRVPRSAFDRSYSVKATMDSGFLYPLHVDEALPGDTYVFRPSFVARLATPLFPYYDGLYLDWQLFFVPVRLVWDNFVKMMGERDKPDDHNDYTMPIMSSDNYTEGSIQDIMGLPVGAINYDHTSLPLRAYALIWDTWYRDANLQDSLEPPTDDGPDLASESWVKLQKRGKRKDYFTGALPFAQRGEPVEMPLGTTAPIIPDPDLAGITWTTSDSPNTDHLYVSYQGAGFAVTPDWAGSGPVVYKTGLAVDLENATAATVNTLRQAVAYQHMFERDARGGGRFREIVLSHFGVQTDDIRLMRPEFVSSGTVPIQTTEVPSTAQNSDAENRPLGDLAAFAKGVGVGRTTTHSATEHGYYIMNVSVRAELSYQYGLERFWSRSTRFDFYWPDLAHIGEQAVLSREIYTDGTGNPDDQTGDFSVWGYQPRYEEYRVRYSRVVGSFRSVWNDSLDSWHLALDFAGSRPLLNDAFIEENPPVPRIVKDQEEPEILLDAHFSVRHVRPMPKFGTPGLLRF